ncbi:MAG: acid phosphatase [Chloroflexi bacterium]|nr:acid phosphatase [Chloroflexota bacterium]
MRLRCTRILASAVMAATLALGNSTLLQAQPSGLQKINHIVVIYQENWSFDGLYPHFPGANGIDQAGATVQQVEKDGKPYTTLPQPLNTTFSPVVPDARFPADLPVAPFDASSYVAANQLTGDALHRYYQEQYQIDGGKMDKFVAWSDAAGLVMSYYDATNMPEGKLAQQFTMLDNLFHGAFGGSFLNHQFLICACAPTWPDAPASIVAQVDSNGFMIKDGQVTPDGFAINTSYTLNSPHPATVTDRSLLLPAQTAPTIGDRLNDQSVSWAWYSGGWNNAVLGHPDPLFQFHQQPFAYYANYGDGTQGRADHLKDEQDFYADVASGNLPAVTFIKALGPDNEHPGYATLLNGQQHVADLVSTIQNSPYWNDAAIIITYDEHGGRWDHVAPPVIDKWGPGLRVPTIVISPFARKGYVDHTQYDTTSILRLIENRWNLPPLAARDAATADLSNAFDFSQG